MVSQPKNIGHQSGQHESETPPSEQYSDDETARRRDEVVRRMINTPPQPRKISPKAKERPASKGRVHKGKTKR